MMVPGASSREASEKSELFRDRIRDLVKFLDPDNAHGGERELNDKLIAVFNAKIACVNQATEDTAKLFRLH